MNKKNTNYKLNNKRDLFFERRKKLNFKLPLLKSNSEIIRFGLYIGGGFFSIVLFACFILIIQFFLLRVKKEKIRRNYNNRRNRINWQRYYSRGPRGNSR